MVRPGYATRRRLLQLAAGVLVAGAAQRLSDVAQAHSTTTSEHRPRASDPRAPAGAASPLAAVPVVAASRQNALHAFPDRGAVRQAAESPFERLLSFLPDLEGYAREVHLTDVALAANRAGVQPPSLEADKDTVLAYVKALSDTGLASPPFISGMDGYARLVTDRPKYLGFGVGNITQMAQAGPPPGTTEVLLGAFNPDTTDAALTACGECAPHTRETHEGVPFYSWGGDYEANLREDLKPPAFDSLGRGGRIAVQPGYVLRTLGTPEMRSAIEAGQEKQPSLANFPTYRPLASAMSELGAHSVFLSNETASQTGGGRAAMASVTGEGEDPIRLALDPAYLLRPYLVVGLGAGIDEAGRYMALGMVHLTEQAAAENAEILPRRVERTGSLQAGKPWSEWFGPVEARPEGRQLLGKVRIKQGPANMWLSWWYNSDSLLYWG